MIVAHLDLDAFFAAVEELEDPDLRSRPLIVGGDPHGRGVVATANYEARKFGIHSAMSAAEALRRCPHAVFVTPRHTLYRDYSRAVWAVVRGVVPTVARTGRGEGRLRAAGLDTIGALAGLADDGLRRLLPGSVGEMLRARARGIDPRPLELAAERISISVENTFERDLADRERLHDELRRMAAEVAKHLHDRGQTARTVTTTLRYADFSIRSRSTSLEVGIDDASRIGELACGLL